MNESFLRDFFGLPRADVKKDVGPPPKRDESVQIFASDDLVRRAEVIVWAVGYRGAVGDHVLAVYHVLQDYAKLDAKPSGPTPGDV